MRAQLCDDGEGSKVLFGELLGESCRMEVLSFDIDQTTDLKRWHGHALGICRALVSLLHMGHLFSEELVK